MKQFNPTTKKFEAYIKPADALEIVRTELNKAKTPFFESAKGIFVEDSTDVSEIEAKL